MFESCLASLFIYSRARAYLPVACRLAGRTRWLARPWEPFPKFHSFLKPGPNRSPHSEPFPRVPPCVFQISFSASAFPRKTTFPWDFELSLFSAGNLQEHTLPPPGLHTPPSDADAVRPLSERGLLFTSFFPLFSVRGRGGGVRRDPLLFYLK